MTLEADSIIARRSLRRSLAIWRILSVLALVFAVTALLVASDSTVGGLSKRTDHIARVKLNGIITGDDEVLKLLEKLKEAKQVRAVILRIDSPGGTTAGSEALYGAIRQLGESKPVVAVMDTVAASGGYIVALATDHIVARGNTITGSVGVLFQWAELQELLNTLGIKVGEIKSGELKAEPSPFDPMSEKARAVTEAMVQDSFRWFLGLVEDRRKLQPAQLATVSDGRVFTGRQALTQRLIDQIGGEQEATQWLSENKGISKDLDILDWEPGGGFGADGIGVALVRAVLTGLGFGGGSWIAEKLLSSERLKVDGLISVWHPQG
jgi:protease-4